MSKPLDQEFAEFLVKAVVSNSDAVVIDRTIDDLGVLLTATVGEGDVGYVIGKQGGTARAIRTLLKAVGAKENARVNFKINQPDDDRRGGGSAGDRDRGYQEGE